MFSLFTKETDFARETDSSVVTLDNSESVAELGLDESGAYIVMVSSTDPDNGTHAVFMIAGNK